MRDKDFQVRGFSMKLKPGCIEAYKQRHDEIWPELVTLLQQSGIVEYHIFLDEESLSLFAFQKRVPIPQFTEDIAQNPIMRRWWAHTADLMEVNDDLSPVVVPCPELFRL